MNLYQIKLGDVGFTAHDFRIQVATRRAKDRRAASGSTSVEVELWIHSNSSYLTDDDRKTLFEYAKFPDNQSRRILTVEVPRKDSDLSLCTYTLPAAWISVLRERRALAHPDIVVYLKVVGQTTTSKSSPAAPIEVAS